MPLEQSYFNTPNLAGAVAIVEAGIADDNDKRKKELREMGHRSKQCECIIIFCSVYYIKIEFSSEAALMIKAIDTHIADRVRLMCIYR